MFWEKYKSESSSLCSFLHSTITSSLLGSDIILNVLFSNTLNLVLGSRDCASWKKGFFIAYWKLQSIQYRQSN